MTSAARTRIVAMALIAAAAFGAGSAIGAAIPDVHDQPIPAEHDGHD